jgi:hypothetical protein
VADGDVVWDGDYMDFIHINRDGHRVLDHSKIDLLKTFKVGHLFPAVSLHQSIFLQSLLCLILEHICGQW